MFSSLHLFLTHIQFPPSFFSHFQLSSAFTIKPIVPFHLSPPLLFSHPHPVVSYFPHTHSVPSLFFPTLSVVLLSPSFLTLSHIFLTHIPLPTSFFPPFSCLPFFLTNVRFPPLFSQTHSVAFGIQKNIVPLFSITLSLPSPFFPPP